MGYLFNEYKLNITTHKKNVLIKYKILFTFITYCEKNCCVIFVGYNIFIKYSLNDII